MMETDFFAAMLVPPFKPSADWAEGMAETLLHPEFPISEMEALGRRLRRNYLWIYSIVGIAWIGRLTLSPIPAHSFADILKNAAFENISGEGMFIIVGVFYAFLLSLALVTVGLRRASGEVLSNPTMMGFDFEDADHADSENLKNEKRAWFRRSRRRQELVALIITDDSKNIAEHIMSDMRRGATILKGEGAYTHTEHTVMMVAITSTEIPVLKKLVAAQSPKAFVMIVPAKNILGGGFMPLEEK